MAGPFSRVCDPPFLIVEFPGVRRTLGWSLLRPGFADVSTVVWLEVRNADLTPDCDPAALLADRLAARRLSGALAFMTSRDIRRHHFAEARVGDVASACLATVGLGNGEDIGARRAARAPVGTINTLVHVSRPLTDGALVEAISIAAQARTAAVLDTGPLRRGPRITGTGTDCIVVATPIDRARDACAGTHTAVGEAIGAAVYRAVREGAEVWSAEFG